MMMTNGNAAHSYRGGEFYKSASANVRSYSFSLSLGQKSCLSHSQFFGMLKNGYESHMADSQCARGCHAAEESQDSPDVSEISRQMSASAPTGHSNTVPDIKQMADEFFDRANELDGVDTTRKLNEESKGDKKLTDEQVALLREKYDVEDLTPQERYDLFCDLTDMGVLTPDEVKSIGVGKFMHSSSLTIVSGYIRIELIDISSISKGNVYARLKFLVEQEEYRYMQIKQLGEQSELSEREQKCYDKFQNDAEEIDSLITSHKKVAEVLSLLVRDK